MPTVIMCIMVTRRKRLAAIRVFLQHRDQRKISRFCRSRVKSGFHYNTDESCTTVVECTYIVPRLVDNALALFICYPVRYYCTTHFVFPRVAVTIDKSKYDIFSVCFLDDWTDCLLFFTLASRDSAYRLPYFRPLCEV